jgi:hypothetical protein
MVFQKKGKCIATRRSAKTRRNNVSQNKEGTKNTIKIAPKRIAI